MRIKLFALRSQDAEGLPHLVEAIATATLIRMRCKRSLLVKKLAID